MRAPILTTGHQSTDLANLPRWRVINLRCQLDNDVLRHDYNSPAVMSRSSEIWASGISISSARSFPTAVTMGRSRWRPCFVSSWFRK